MSHKSLHENRVNIFRSISPNVYIFCKPFLIKEQTTYIISNVFIFYAQHLTDNCNPVQKNANNDWYLNFA